MNASGGDRNVVALWLLAAVTAAGVLWRIQTHYEVPMRAVRSENVALYEGAARNRALVRDSAQLEADQRRALGDIRSFDFQPSETQAVGSVLTAIDRVAAHSRVLVRDFLPDALPAPSSRPAPSLRTARYTLGVRGGYRALMQFVEALSRQRTPVRLDALSMESSTGAAGTRNPRLDAALSLTLYYMKDAR